MRISIQESVCLTATSRIVARNGYTALINSDIVQALERSYSLFVGASSPFITTPKALTDRELEVLCLIGRGKTSKEVSTVLGIRPETVRSHRRQICRKLSLHSTAELISTAALCYLIHSR